MKIQSVFDDSFATYGQVLEGYDFTELLDTLAANSEKPEDSVIYVPSVDVLESTAVYQQLRDHEYGGMPIQIGYCNGKNHRNDTLEYHRGEELDIAVTDLIVVLGSRKDMDSLTSFDLAHAEAFLIPAGTGVMLYSDTLHYAPCSVGDDVFQCIIVLPQGTNYPSEKENIQKTDEDKLLCMKNKWVITHPDSGEPYYPGLKGDIIMV